MHGKVGEASAKSADQVAIKLERHEDENKSIDFVEEPLACNYLKPADLGKSVSATQSESRYLQCRSNATGFTSFLVVICSVTVQRPYRNPSMLRAPCR